MTACWHSQSHFVLRRRSCICLPCYCFLVPLHDLIFLLLQQLPAGKHPYEVCWTSISLFKEIGVTTDTMTRKILTASHSVGIDTDLQLLKYIPYFLKAKMIMHRIEHMLQSLALPFWTSMRPRSKIGLIYSYTTSKSAQAYQTRAAVTPRIQPGHLSR